MERWQGRKRTRGSLPPFFLIRSALSRIPTTAPHSPSSLLQPRTLPHPYCSSALSLVSSFIHLYYISGKQLRLESRLTRAKFALCSVRRFGKVERSLEYGELVVRATKAKKNMGEKQGPRQGGSSTDGYELDSIVQRKLYCVIVPNETGFIC